MFDIWNEIWEVHTRKTIIIWGYMYGHIAEGTTLHYVRPFFIFLFVFVIAMNHVGTRCDGCLECITGDGDSSLND